MNRKPFVPSINLRRQFGDPDKPLWGASFDDLCHIPASEIAEVLVEKSDPDIEAIVGKCAKELKGVGLLSARDLVFKIGVMLNEIERVEVMNGQTNKE